ncbi:MAG: DUF2158 domain-containing protein [Ignavibacteriae bacterium]|nr:MAG: DUF2158 domain-containing protein [Ignavibacteriota bacterium]
MELTSLNFHKGDIVRLKSGSPQMTIQAITNNGLVDCIWFDKDGKHVESFPVETLEKVDSNESSISFQLREKRY